MSTCWLWDNGWATVDDDGTLAGYMDGGREQEAECHLLRPAVDPCPVHGIYTVSTNNAQAMRDEAKLDHTVVGWEPGWSFNGPRSVADQDDGDATLAVHAVDFGDTVASIEIAHIFPDILGRGYSSTVGIELTLGEVRDLIERLSEIRDAVLMQVDDVRFAVDHYVGEVDYLITLPDYDEADVLEMVKRRDRLLALLG